MPGTFNRPLDLAGFVVRPKFRWKDADEIYIGAGVYDHRGVQNQAVYWDSELTFVAGSGGSNAASVDLDASNWFYLYIDDSAVVTAGTNLLTAAQLVMNKTAPTWNAAKHGLYNGLDRCIFADLTTGANALIEFLHDGDTVWWADRIENQAALDIDLVYTDIGALKIPGFATRGLISALSSGNIPYQWKTNGATGTVGHYAGYAHSSQGNKAEVITDSAQVIEIKMFTDDAGTIQVFTDGWKFPTGM